MECDILKEINVKTANEFHEWQRVNLPSSLVIQDLDSWAVVISDSKKDYVPCGLFELKRSFEEVDKWSPYKDDYSNYKALFTFATKASLPFFTIYFKKGGPLIRVAWFEVRDVNAEKNDWIVYDKEILTSDQLKKKILDLTNL